MVATQLENISEIGSFPQIGVNQKKFFSFYLPDLASGNLMIQRDTVGSRHNARETLSTLGIPQQELSLFTKVDMVPSIHKTIETVPWPISRRARILNSPNIDAKT